MMSCQDKVSLLRLAETAALTTGRQLRQRLAGSQEAEFVFEHDVKIRADKSAQTLIQHFLEPSNLPMLCEESPNLNFSPKDLQEFWIVDPLDGSLNYHQGIPFCCISIALFRKTEPVLGLIYDFFHEELFSGIVGDGAWLNGQPIHPSTVNETGSAVLTTGFPAGTDYSLRSLTRFAKNIQQFRKVRLLGSAALSLCYVACGRADAYREDNIMLWDVAAGCSILRAAGASVDLRIHGAMTESVSLTAHNGRLGF